MRRFKSVVALILAAVLLTSTALAVQFPDVDPNSTIGKAVDYLSNLGVLGGYEDGTFKPDATVTRAQFAKIVYMMENQGTADPNADAYKGNSAFFDVAAEQWFSGYVNWAYQQKIIGGMGDGTFQPDGTLTYAQAIKMYVVAAGVDDSGYSYPNDYIAKAKELGILENVYYGHPNDGASRGNIAVMGYNKLAGGTVNPPVQKPAAYRLCAQAPDFGALFGVRHVTRQEEADVLMYTYTTPGRPQQVGDAYSDALSAYGYTYSGNFTDSDGRPVNVYANGSGYKVLFSCNSKSAIVMVSFPDGQGCDPYQEPYYLEAPRVPNFGYYSKVPVVAYIQEDQTGAVYTYDTGHYNFSIGKANSYLEVLRAKGYPWQGNLPVDGVEYRIYQMSDGFVAVGVDGRNFVVMVLMDDGHTLWSAERITAELRAQRSAAATDAVKQQYQNYRAHM